MNVIDLDIAQFLQGQALTGELFKYWKFISIITSSDISYIYIYIYI